MDGEWKKSNLLLLLRQSIDLNRICLLFLFHNCGVGIVYICGNEEKNLKPKHVGVCFKCDHSFRPMLNRRQDKIHAHRFLFPFSYFRFLLFHTFASFDNNVRSMRYSDC